VPGILPEIPPGFDAPSFTGDAFTQQCEGTLTPFLRKLRLPARYIGGERNSLHKDWDSTRFRMALGFPDLYELGMSYLGTQLLYATLNAPEKWTPMGTSAAGGSNLCERFFMPDEDACAVMLQQGIALFTLESKRPLRDFDAVGISFTHERSFLNLPLLLRLARISTYSRDRGDDLPIIIGGGACMLNPEPIADMLDAVAIGEGEEMILDIAHCLAECRNAPRARRISELSHIPGIYIPSYYEARYEGGCFHSLVPRSELPSGVYAPMQIQRRILQDFAEWPPPTDLIAPWIDTPGNWANIEVMRGCPQRCRFCHAGHVYLPARARDADIVVSSALKLAVSSGADQLSLQALSVLDHPQIISILERLRPELDKRMISLSVPSLRMDSISRQIAELMRRPKESSLTFAPEAGSSQIRDAINKRLSETDLHDTIEYASKAGWHKFKLYFMCGFPGEKDEDVEAIVNLTRELKRIAREHAPHPPQINVSVNVLIPKPHTPMQWAPLAGEEELRSKQALLRSEFAKMGKSISLSYTDYGEALLETLLSRGDRRLASVIATARESGLCDAEGRLSSKEALTAVCEGVGVNVPDEVHCVRSHAEPLPWAQICTGVDTDYLWREWEMYQRAETSPPCVEACVACGMGCV
jgi:radical SAM family uncharacterized protein